MNGTVLEVKDLTVRFDNSTVLEGVNLEVNQGDVVGIVGPNGGGKTTLLNAILGNVPAATGSIRLFGQDISEFKEFERVGYVSQNAIQFDPIFPATVREIVALGCVRRSNMGRLLKASDWEDVDSAIKTVGLSGLADRKISELSGGQKQRIFIARALVKKPRLLILDEAAAGLDICIQDQFVQILRHLRSKEEMTILTVSHDLSGVMCQANKLAVVNRKVYVTDITPTTDPTPILREAYGHHFTFIFHHDHESCQGI
ncbi:MAG: ABC transporter ATP-binding protein [Methanomassiliicoccales archaeon]|nr:ABC transporter ATP-binding protein [Methanomassiliicoccales archaeon]